MAVKASFNNFEDMPSTADDLLIHIRSIALIVSSTVILFNRNFVKNLRNVVLKGVSGILFASLGPAVTRNLFIKFGESAGGID